MAGQSEVGATASESEAERVRTTGSPPDMRAESKLYGFRGTRALNISMASIVREGHVIEPFRVCCRVFPWARRLFLRLLRSVRVKKPRYREISFEKCVSLRKVAFPFQEGGNSVYQFRAGEFLEMINRAWSMFTVCCTLQRNASQRKREEFDCFAVIAVEISVPRLDICRVPLIR